MVNELEKVELYGANNDGAPRRYTIADGTSVSQGTILSLSDPRTAGVAIAATDMFAGVASMEKEANDGTTSISAWTDGIFEAKASGAIAIGENVKGVEDNMVMATASTSGAAVLGYAMETATDAETINIRVRL